jgi:hypothetical protein
LYLVSAKSRRRKLNQIKSAPRLLAYILLEPNSGISKSNYSQRYFCSGKCFSSPMASDLSALRLLKQQQLKEMKMKMKRKERGRLNRRIRKKGLWKLKTATLDQHFEQTLGRVRAEFERTGEIHPGFECVTDAEIFHVPAHWPDRSAKGAACAALRDSFRRRGVNRYLFTGECWVAKTPGLRPADDPDRGESVQVIAVERNGLRRYAFVEITRNGGMATLGPWQVNGDVPQGWLLELLEEGHSDRAVKAEPPPVGRVSTSDFQDLADQQPEHAAEFRASVEIRTELEDLIADQMQKGANSDPMAMFMALESVLRSIVKDMGSPKGLGQFARFLRDHPDKFPMFSTVPDQAPSTQAARSWKASFRGFSCEKREAGHAVCAIFGAFMNMYMRVGSQAIGALELADRIEDWDPEQQAKLRQAGLRSSFELDDEEGRVFIALSADRYPTGVMGRRNAVGDLFVSRIVSFPDADFATAIDNIKQTGLELIMGSEAKELLRKMEQVKGVVPQAHKSKEIWELQNWGKDEWTEQALAELVFSKAMNVQYSPEPDNVCGGVAGYRVRRAPNGLVLVPTDNDDDIFVAVKVETTKMEARVLGWLRGSEGKVSEFYQKNCWVIPPEVLHDMEELPYREQLQTMPPFQELSA